MHCIIFLLIWIIVWSFSTPLNWRMITFLKWKSAVWYVNKYLGNFFFLYLCTLRLIGNDIK